MTVSASFPLNWPFNRPRTNKYSRQAGRFKSSMAKSRDELINELRRLGASQLVISTNIETYMRGKQEIPYADQLKSHEDPGVAIYYTWKGDQYTLCCDKYKVIVDNLQAIVKTINAIRGIDRWGTGEMMKAAFSGFKALPEPEKSIHIWNAWEILKIKIGSSRDEIKRAYRELAFIYHPDMPNGNINEFNKIQRAYDELTPN